MNRLLSSSDSLFLRVLQCQVQNLSRASYGTEAIADLPKEKKKSSRIAKSSTTVKAKPFAEIPGPRSLPFMGTSWMNFPIVGGYSPADTKSFRQHLRKQYGDIVKIYPAGPSIPFVFLFSREDIRTVYLHEMDQFEEGIYPNRPPIESLVAVRKGIEQFGGNPGLALISGKDWRLAHDKFSAFRTVGLDYQRSIEEVADGFVEWVYELRDLDDKVKDLQEELKKWALESIVKTTMGVRIQGFKTYPDGDTKQFIESLSIGLRSLTKLFYKPPLWKYSKHLSKDYRDLERSHKIQVEKSCKYINRVRSEIYKGEAGGPDDNTILKRWLSDPNIEKNEVLAMMIDVLGGGVDTTALSVMNTMLFLGTHPATQEKAYQQVKKLVAKGKEPVSYNTLPYLHACLKEALRLQPVFDTIARVTQDEMVLGGFKIPVNTYVFSPHRETGQDARFVPDYHLFMPERWIRNETPFKGVPSQYISMPFGIGKRACFGRFIAEQESVVLLAKLLLRYRLTYKELMPNYKGFVLQQPDKKINLYFTERTG